MPQNRIGGTDQFLAIHRDAWDGEDVATCIAVSVATITADAIARQFPGHRETAGRAIAAAAMTAVGAVLDVPADTMREIDPLQLMTSILGFTAEKLAREADEPLEPGFGGTP